MSHTPGPWSVHGDNRPLIGCDDRKMMLAEVLWEHVCTEWGRPIAEAQANARLMASAPYLLQALKELELRTRQFIAGELVAFPAALLPQVQATIKYVEGHNV